MSYQKCATCDVYHHDAKTHKCPPKWSCWDELNLTPEDPMEVHAQDSESAAEVFQEKFFEGSGECPEAGKEYLVFVREKDNSVSKFKVLAEYSVDYYATQIK